MKTIRHLIYREALSAVAFVTLGFLALFFFFDMVDELRWVGRTGPDGYQLSHAMLFVALSIPSHLYELLPITVLIGTIFVMARLAQSSEFTIMRTSGLGPWRALRTLLVLGLGFVMLTFAVGDYIAPVTDRAAQLVKARHLGQLTTGATGAWLKERQGSHSMAVNVRALSPDGGMLNIRVFEFDADGRVASTLQAASGTFASDHWELKQVKRSVFHRSGDAEARVERLQEAELRWPTRISTDMVSASLLKPDRMATIDLFQYIRHLESNGQAAQRYEIEFWRKVFYPLSCLVMVVLSLPFAYLHFRSGGIAGYVFGGVMAGISFFLLNNVFGYAGNLQNWSPWLTAAAPGLIYSVLSLAAFGWLVLRR
ncbi:LPS export ABC transporter permease LptG [Paracidovorax valerianellae]|uniref:Lipopolysaccharide export system permease protein n=1 Tax=Paracidovorax valerianellae TaxID=187868 RepID=A0A1G6UXP0_9BURK|nr:LPS export ABC transporter permease LptG [Paracidovorax valerianellae]MDA8447506.1 LPS export ABC transporter permease LptG [Paracidovorax valerianellae]SDD46082.1 lipopolysaccharide export system permease protein [Paracidovorax valerianellae]